MPRSCCWNARSVHSNVMPFGSTSLANSSMRCNAVPVATPGAAPLHLGSRKQVVARHAIGDRLAPQLRYRPDRHHLAGCVAGFEAGDVLRSAPELLVALYPDLIGAAETVEVVDVL